MITDCYPDKFGVQKLFLYDFDQNECKVLYQTRVGSVFNGTDRCDFHPRSNIGGTKVSFDSPYEGQRCHIVIDLKTNDES
jgi:hypothetical protein